MLVIVLKLQDKMRVNDDIVLLNLGRARNPNYIRIGIEAPEKTVILRGELLKNGDKKRPLIRYKPRKRLIVLKDAENDGHTNVC
jgi:sRNA-binding carbon storage regulator CsrA